MTDLPTEEDIAQFAPFNDKFVLIERIGEGTFSTVFKAKDIRLGHKNARTVAIKMVTRTTSPMRICEELNFLKLVREEENIIHILYVERFEDQIIIVFPLVEYTDFREFLEVSTLEDIKWYMYNLLLAIKNTHKYNIIHRDLKPSNFLYNKNGKKGVLIDFGLAEHEKSVKTHIDQEEKKKTTSFFRNSLSRNLKPPGFYMDDARPPLKAPRAGTRGFRAPEVLFKVHHQTKKIDIWCAGIIFLILLTKRYPFFAGADDLDASVELATIFGIREMKKAAKYYERTFKTNLDTVPMERISFEQIVGSLNPGFEVGFEAFDLLYMLLDLYAEKRITAECALNHPFFANMQ
ncbi:CDC7 protein kinase [Edhazardia aedis USNM 41457]|uniref:non-specific serine/threonine protein kinase n=1 Tax=Edhazardia aedis (strain USNM 41457) TaxID=1003232 RepID=J9D6H6_EDHAE|nr:CDC7 protein kinase [Edhazardia aedis USNM 41457]|eukprot:EJW03114.1 CDC7 protein kinase [Edhazardia aedis USNM 41457]